MADEKIETWSDADIKKLWPQAYQELLGFQNHLMRSNMGLTAAQLGMALQLAQEAFDKREGSK